LRLRAIALALRGDGLVDWTLSTAGLNKPLAISHNLAIMCPVLRPDFRQTPRIPPFTSHRLYRCDCSSCVAS